MKLIQKLKQLFKWMALKDKKKSKKQKENSYCRCKELAERIKTLKAHLKNSQAVELNEMTRLNELIRKGKEGLKAKAKQVEEADKRHKQALDAFLCHLEDDCIKLKEKYQDLLGGIPALAACTCTTTEDANDTTCTCAQAVQTSKHCKQWTVSNSPGGPAFFLHTLSTQNEHQQTVTSYQGIDTTSAFSAPVLHPYPEYLQTSSSCQNQPSQPFIYHFEASAFKIYTKDTANFQQEEITAEDREVETILTGVPEPGECVQDKEPFLFQIYERP